LRVLALIPEHGFFLGTTNLDNLYIKTMNILGTEKITQKSDIRKRFIDLFHRELPAFD
jgi:hypothetical protein